MIEKEYREFLLNRDGAINEMEVRRYMREQGSPMYNIKEQELVLERMKMSKCSKCEIKQQVKYIEGLRNEQSN